MIELEEQVRQAAMPTREAWQRVWKALVLSPSLEIFEALLRGERVPIDRLDQEWVRRLGRRPR